MRYTFFRIMFADGTFGGWLKDYTRVLEDAKFFRGSVQAMTETGLVITLQTFTPGCIVCDYK